MAASDSKVTVKGVATPSIDRLSNVAFVVCVLFLSACGGSIKSTGNAYSYLGRVVDTLDESVTEQVSRPQIGLTVVGGVISAAPTGENVIVDRRSSYRRYKVALDQGEQITLRSRTSIATGSCVRVWIYGPGVSPVYWYDPASSEIEIAEGCRAASAR